MAASSPQTVTKQTDAQGNMTLTGTDGNDVLIGYSGNDLLIGGGGDDLLYAGDGRDTLLGGDGNDTLEVTGSHAGMPLVEGGAGDDLFRIGPTTAGVSVAGGEGRDVFGFFYASPSMPYVVTDFVAGDGGDRIDLASTLRQGISKDPHWSGANPFAEDLGYLRLVQNGTSTELQYDADGKAGGVSQFKTVITLLNTTVASLTAANFVGDLKPDGSNMPGVSLTGTDGNDWLTGDVYQDSLSGGAGNDTLVGGAGDDWLSGDDGNDVLGANEGNDTLIGGAGNDGLYGRQGDDSLDGGDGDDKLYAEYGGNDTLQAGDGDDLLVINLNGGHGRAHADGGAGNDTFSVYMGNASGADKIVLHGGAGRDIFMAYGPAAGEGAEIDDFVAGPGGDRINLDELLNSYYRINYVGGNPFAPGSLLRLVQDGADTLLQMSYKYWNAPDQFLTVYKLTNVQASSLTADNFSHDIDPAGIDAHGDLLTGTAGNDSLVGWFLNDTLNGGDGDDELEGKQGDDSLDGGAGNDYLQTAWGGNDTLSGGDGDDRFYADTGAVGGGHAVLDGGAGNDYFSMFAFGKIQTITATGGSGRDTYRPVGVGAGHVTDFAAGASGDLITLDSLLYLIAGAGYQGGNPFAQGFVRLQQQGDDTLLQIQQSSGGSYDTVLVLDKTLASAFTAANFLENIDPNGSATPGVNLQAGNAGEGLTGTSFNDTLNGGTGNDTLWGNGGDDLLHAHSDAAHGARLFGGSGQDTLIGGDGNDSLDGDIGDDSLDGGAGNDVLTHQADGGSDTIAGGAGDDRFVITTQSDDVLQLDGGAGNDAFVLSKSDYVAGKVSIDGGAGRDTYRPETQNTLDVTINDFTAGAGGDVIDLGYMLDFSASMDFLGYYGGNPFKSGYLQLVQQGADTLVQYDPDGGDPAHYMRQPGTVLTLKNVLASSLTAENFVVTVGGISYMLPPDGSGITGVQYTASAGGAGYHGGRFNDTVTGGAGNDSLYGAGGDDKLIAQGGSDALYGEDGNDSLTGGAGADTLNGGAGDDVLVKGSGNNVLAGGLGSDTYWLDSAGGSIKEEDYGSYKDIDKVWINYASGSYTQVNFVEIAQLTSTAGASVKLIGNASANLLIGNAGANQLTGNEGSDTLDGGAGNDTMVGGKGGDTYVVDAIGDVVVEENVLYDDADKVETTLSRYTLPDFVEYLIYKGSAAFTGIGNAGANIFEVSIAGGSIDGGGSLGDTVQGLRSIKDYTLSRNVSGDLVLTYKLNAATLTLRNVEYLKFSDSWASVEYLTSGLATDRNDQLRGYYGADLLNGAAGDDTINSGEGNDTLDGGTGADKLFGELGDDVYIVDNTGDVVTELEDQGVDTVRTSLSKYTLGVNVENLLYTGTAGFTGTGNALDNLLTGGAGADSIVGGAGNDTITAGGGKDTIDGGVGMDVLQGLGNFSSYTVYRPNITDTVLTDKSGNSITVRGVESFAFADGSKTLAQIQDGTPSGGNDILHGTDGNDVMNGGAGMDVMDGGLGDDTYVISNLNSRTIEQAGEGTDLVQLTIAGMYKLGDGVENGTVTAAASVVGNLMGNELDNVLTGNGAGNTLAGGAGNDTLDGGAGADRMSGGSGNDTYIVDVAGDSVTELLNDGNDTVKTGLASYVLGANLENLLYTGAAAFTGAGNALDNIITGGDKGNKLDGGAGNDSLSAGSGADSILGGLGNDTIAGGAGKDTIDGGDGADVLQGLGQFADYSVARPNATDTVLTDKAGNVITVRGVEKFIFDGVDKTLAEVQYNVASIGNDNLHGTDGNDSINGGTGIDTMTGGLGNDIYVVDNLADVVVESSAEGNDLVQVALAAAGIYKLGDNIEHATVTAAASIAVSLTGNALDNALTGNAAANTLNGGAGNDTLDGAAGADKLLGGAGDDTYVVDNAGDAITEAQNEGTDAVRTSLASYTLGANLENVAYTGSAAFTGTGNALDNIITGGDKGNKLDGGAGNDRLTGGAGADSLLGGLGNDILVASAGKDTIDGGAGTDILDGLGDFSNYTVTRPNATDTVLTDKAGNIITVRGVESFSFAGAIQSLAEVQDNIASIGNDSLRGTDGDDSINGGAGIDTMAGGLGNDIYVIDVAGDVVTEKSGEGIDQVNVAFANAGIYVLTANVEHAAVTAVSAAISLTGNELDNKLAGNGAANMLTGGLGDDTLDGGAGADKLIGGLGNDVYVVDASGDVVTELVSEGTDTVQTVLASYTLGSNVENLRYTGSKAFSGSGNAGNNVLEGGSGNDVLKGLAGSDTLAGGAGNDTLTGGADIDYFVFSSAIGSDTVTDFVSGVDAVLVKLAIGNGDAAIDGGEVRAAKGGFSADAELVILTPKMASASTANAAAVIGSATGNYDVGDTALFAVSTSNATVLYRFLAANGDAVVSAAELTQVAVLTGTPGVTLDDFIFA
jgi:Ca2+-binding RTX toxin-like protein